MQNSLRHLVLGNTSLDKYGNCNEQKFDDEVARISAAENPIIELMASYPVQRFLGGPAFNVASTLKRHGIANLAVITIAGTRSDPFAKAAIKAYQEMRIVDPTGVKKTSCFMSQCGYLIGNPSIGQEHSWYESRASKHFANMCLEDYRGLLGFTNVLHLPSTHPHVAKQAVDIVSSDCFIAFYPGVRVRGDSFDRNNFETIAEKANLILLNQTEAQSIADHMFRGEIGGLRNLLINCPKLELIGITLGSEGSLFFTNEGKEKYDLSPGNRVHGDEIKNSAGAGDAYAPTFTLAHTARLPINMAADVAHAEASKILKRPGASFHRLDRKGRRINR